MPEEMNRDGLIARMQQGYEDFVAHLKTFTPAQLTIPTDAAGWSIKDHVMHLAIWEGGVAAMLHQEIRHEAMGLDAATWKSRDIDRINAVIQQSHRTLSFAEVMRRFETAHARMMATIEAMSWEDMHRPSGRFLPAGKENDEGRPVIEFIIGDGYEHYAEHRPWIDDIPDIADVQDRDALLYRMDRAWDYLNGYMGTLTDQQAAIPKDAVGWTAKDHLMHFAVWVGSVVVLLNKQPRHEYMGLDQALWESTDYETINAILQARHKDLAWSEVKRRVEDSHRRLTEKVRTMSWDDLQKP
ncbi:MAG: ClbS/DfsB family four-helix bundle protein, partial [Anaerolineae bacterium]|nr:ClbS/DfsB family four-helix bundle protein [Anaerolineae bacterium]